MNNTDFTASTASMEPTAQKVSSSAGLAHLPLLIKELEKENRTTREMLSRIPDSIYGWQPHPKSMTVKQLANHLAELPAWTTMVLTTDGLDFASNPYKPNQAGNTAAVLELYDQSYQAARHALENAPEDQLEQIWTLSNGATVLAADNKLATIRMCYCQIVHHRAQLGVYLRLNDIALPPSYGPSADEGGR